MTYFPVSRKIKLPWAGTPDFSDERVATVHSALNPVEWVCVLVCSGFRRGVQTVLRHFMRATRQRLNAHPEEMIHG
jgi:hypothetical protein